VRRKSYAGSVGTGATARARSALAAACLVVAALPFGAACGKTNSGGGCTEIGCESAIRATIPFDSAGARTGPVATSMCLDGTCRNARGTVAPRHGGRDLEGAGFRQSGIDVTVDDHEFEVKLSLGHVDYDNVTPHEIRVEFQIGGNETVILERAGPLERFDPNGVNCEPTCWQAELTTDDRVL
jgi:hypothetical protein